MKYFKTYCIALLVLTTAFSCSDDDSDTPNDPTNENPNTVAGNYFPLTVSDYWNYDVENTNNTTSETTMSTDNLYVISETAGVYDLDVNNGLIANGTMDSYLSNVSLARNETTLISNGALELPAEISDLIDFEININNIVLYDTEANNDVELSSNSSSVQQDFNGVPVTISYTLFSKSVDFSEEMMINGSNYDNVLTTKLVLNLNVAATLSVQGIPFNINIIEPQNVLVITNYFSKNIGLIKAEANTSYTISPTAISALELAGFEINVPTSGSTTNIQNLTTYSVN